MHNPVSTTAQIRRVPPKSPFCHPPSLAPHEENEYVNLLRYLECFHLTIHVIPFIMDVKSPTMKSPS
ncbi:hypothetical protein VTO42DRAFT_2976 [Malbranchea cinnamomea]